ncbi:MAG: hypothetical protein ABI053_08820 [Lacisediminihabitans sp.]
MRPFDESALPAVEPFSLEDAVSEGLMLAEHSSRLRLKNRVIIGVLTQSDAFDAKHYIGEAKKAIDVLVDEFDLDVDRIGRKRRIAISIPGRAKHAHDYRSVDADNLRLREDVSAAVARALRSHRGDEPYLLHLIESARQDAWGEISRAIEEFLDRSNIVVDNAYKRGRSGRIRLLITEDLAKLMASVSA